MVKGGNPLTYELYEGRFIKELETYGLSLDACASDLGACASRLWLVTGYPLSLHHCSWTKSICV